MSHHCAEYLALSQQLFGVDIKLTYRLLCRVIEEV